MSLFSYHSHSPWRTCFLKGIQMFINVWILARKKKLSTIHDRKQISKNDAGQMMLNSLEFVYQYFYIHWIVAQLIKSQQMAQLRIKFDPLDPQANIWKACPSKPPKILTINIVSSVQYKDSPSVKWLTSWI